MASEIQVTTAYKRRNGISVIIVNASAPEFITKTRPQK